MRWTPETAAQVGKPVVRNSTGKDLRGASQFWTLLRDRRGLLYAGASNSDLLQYDGVAWRPILTSSNVTRSLARYDQGGSGWAARDSLATWNRMPPAL